KRLSRWIIPDTDLKSGELFVRVTTPVYDGDRFIGVIAANMQLAGIAEQVNSIKVGKTGYAYMIDDAGHIISMPQAGLDMFGIRAENLSTKEFYQRSIEDAGTLELKSLTKRMMAGGSGLSIVDVNGIKTYISYAPIRTNGYSVALVVPVVEMQTEIIAAREETNQQNQTAVRTAVIILVILFVSAIAVSFGLGRIIAAPIQRLTQAATQVAAGDLSVQAATTAKDEIGILGQSFNTMTERLRETLDGLEHMVHERTSELLLANERNERRARQFESIAQVARTISSTRDLSALLGQITTVISREFGFYHVGIFLLDTSREYAVLSAANSEGGKAMMKRGHRLKVGETGIVGYVTGTGTPRVALDTGADAVFFNNPDLPNTRSEIALPLRSGDEIIGALDVQSIESDAFSQEDINILSTLADQVSVAIQNARQFEETRKALREAEALAKQFAKDGWQQYTRDKNLVGIHHTGAKATLLYDRSGDKEKEESNRNVASSHSKPRGTRLSLPIELRGEVIGSVDVRSPDSRPWDQDELDIITAIIERSAVAMENARLLEESQRLASKESKISAVTAKIGASINMRNVLQTAVEELGRALPGSEVVIQFQTDENKTTS
ncbi:MAG TPA: GAF domain-containing protein, partial [Anaerolineales bacterium]|nr:GAF domain-containing protein [Anaerolineales bacterium]